MTLDQRRLNQAAQQGMSLAEALALAENPHAAWAVHTVDAEESLIDYAALMWHLVEPRRPFIRSWVMEAICDHLQAVTEGGITKLLINVPPGFAKSLLTCVLWPSWEWGPRNEPGLRYVCASYSQALTVRDNLRCRLVMKSDDYQQRWGNRFEFSADQDAKIKFSNDKTGFKIATSVSGLGTGERGDRVVIDDPHNVLEGESDAKREEALMWFSEVMPTRINDPENPVFVVIMQRVHEQDVSGLILEKELGYTHLCVPMHYDHEHPHAGRRSMVSVLMWQDPRRARFEAGGPAGELAFPERYSKKAVDDLSNTQMAWGGRYAVEGQLEQRPIPRGGGMVLRDWFEIVDRVPAGYTIRSRGWDFAATEGGDEAGSASVRVCELSLGRDYDEGTPDTDIYIEDAWWDHVSPGGLYTRIALTCQQDEPANVFQSFPQDPAQAGKYQVNDLLKAVKGYDFEFTLESGEKEVRFRPFAAQAETRSIIGRKIKLVRGNWNDQWLDHVCSFPRGRYKDLADATSRAYGGVVKRGGGTFLVGGSVLITPNNLNTMVPGQQVVI